MRARAAHPPNRNPTDSQMELVSISRRDHLRPLFQYQVGRNKYAPRALFPAPNPHNNTSSSPSSHCEWFAQSELFRYFGSPCILKRRMDALKLKFHCIAFSRDSLQLFLDNFSQTPRNACLHLVDQL